MEDGSYGPAVSASKSAQSLDGNATRSSALSSQNCTSPSSVMASLFKRGISSNNNNNNNKDKDDDDDDADAQEVDAGTTGSAQMDGDEGGLTERKSSAIPLGQRTGIRGRLHAMLVNQNFDLVMGSIIISNIGVMVFETDINARCAGSPDGNQSCKRSVIEAVNIMFLGFYTLEAALRLYVLRWRTFYSAWNLLDLFIVVTGYVDLIMSQVDTAGMPGPSMSLLRIFRVFRLLRAVRVFQKIPELYAMLRGFVSAMQSMFWGFIMVIVLLLLFSVLCVELIHPLSLQINDEDAYCREAFGTVWHCMIMFFQTLVAGDSWGHCAIPVIKEQWWTFTIFAGALICVQLGFMNLILAVIVERASRAKDEDEDEIRKEKVKSERKATNRLQKLFKTIDDDQSGSISMEELLGGFDSNKEMQNMFGSLDMTRADVMLLFNLLDTENEGELSYDFLIENLRMSQSDTRKSLTMLRLQSSEITRCLKKVYATTSLIETGAPKKAVSARSNPSRTAANQEADESESASETRMSPRSPLTVLAQKQRRKSRTDGDREMVQTEHCSLETLDQAGTSLRLSFDKDFQELHKNMAKLSELSESVLAACNGSSSSRRPAERKATAEFKKADFADQVYHNGNINQSNGEPTLEMSIERENTGGSLKLPKDDVFFRQASNQSTCTLQPMESLQVSVSVDSTRFWSGKSDALKKAPTPESPSGNSQSSESNLRVVSLVDDRTLQVNNGGRQGEVSL